MKKLVILGALLFGIGGDGKAQTAVDKAAGTFWGNMVASENFHLFDNASAMVFKDLNRHVYYTGVGTSLYAYSYVSLDLLMVKPLGEGSSFIPGAGVTLQAGKALYERVGFVKRMADYIGKAAPIISGGNIGVGYSRNFANGANVEYVYGGLFHRFDVGGK